MLRKVLQGRGPQCQIATKIFKQVRKYRRNGKYAVIYETFIFPLSPFNYFKRYKTLNKKF